MAYWFGGTGNWSDAAHWSNNSGNVPASLLGHAPTASDDVIFDMLSNATDYTVTVDATATCRDFTMGAPLAGKVTWAGSASFILNIYGNLNLSGGTAGITMTFTGSGIALKATSGTKTITTNSVPISSKIDFSGAGAIFQLADKLTSSFPGTSGASNLVLTNGTFDPNGKEVEFTGTGYKITGAFTFYDLTFTGTAIKTTTLFLNANNTVTHTLTIAGNSAINRILITSDTIGIPHTIDITGTTGNSISNADFKDITGAGGPITGTSIGDCGGNTGITFDAPANQFWYKASGAANNWSTVGNWYLGTGGSGGAGRVPLPQDTAIFDDLSFGAAGMTVTQDMPRIPSTTFKGVDGIHPVANTPTFTTSTTASVFGSLTLVAGMTLTASSQDYTFEGRGSYTLTSAGKTWTKNVIFNAPGGIYVFVDDFINTIVLNCTNGTLDALTNNVNVTTRNFALSSVGLNATVNMGSGTWVMTYSGVAVSSWSAASNKTLNANTSTIKLTGSTTNDNITFAGGGKTYNNIWFSRGASTGSITISGNNTFTTLKDDGSAAHSLIGTVGSTQHVTNWEVSGAGTLIKIDSTTTGTWNLIKDGGGVVSADWLDIQHCVATPDNTWYAGTHSVNHQGTATAGSGWIFTNKIPSTQNSQLDSNYVRTLIATADSDGVSPVILYANPTTHALLIDDDSTGVSYGTGQAPRDKNSIPCILAANSSDGITAVSIYAHPAFNALSVVSV